MSLLLDALRKSEARRRMQTPPLIDLRLEGQHPAGSRRRAGRFLVAAAGVGVVLAMLWWVWISPPSDPTLTLESPGPLDISDVGVETAPEPVEEIAPDPVAPARPPPVRDSVQRADPQALESLRRRTQLAQDRSPQSSAAGAPGGAAATGPDGPTPSSSPVAADEQRPEYVQVWELPTRIRTQLPELKLTFVVYSARPEERFVLINGERWVEGQQISPGLTLHEIQRRGAVLDYGDYRFLIE